MVELKFKLLVILQLLKQPNGSPLKTSQLSQMSSALLLLVMIELCDYGHTPQIQTSFQPIQLKPFLSLTLSAINPLSNLSQSTLQRNDSSPPPKITPFTTGHLIHLNLTTRSPFPTTPLQGTSPTRSASSLNPPPRLSVKSPLQS